MAQGNVRMEVIRRLRRLTQIKSTDYADYTDYDKVIVEIKAISGLSGIEESQIINYLKATKLKVGLLINFGSKSLEHKRFIYCV